MSDKTQYREYITQVLESEELFIQQMQQLQQNMNSVAQESLRRRKAYEIALRQIEEREEIELQGLQTSRPSQLQNQSYFESTTTTFPDISEVIASIKQSQSSLQPLTSTPIKITASSFASPSVLNASKIGMKDKVAHAMQDLAQNCQLLPCPHCGKLIKICLCASPQSPSNSRTSSRSQSEGSKQGGSSDSSRSTLWEDNFTIKYEESSVPASNGYLNTVATAEANTVVQTTTEEGWKKNTSQSKQISFNKDLTAFSFVKSPSNRTQTVNNMEILMSPPPPVGILSKYENVYLHNFPVPEQNGNSSSQLKGEDLLRQLLGVLNPITKTEPNLSTNKTALSSRSTSGKVSGHESPGHAALVAKAKVLKEKSVIHNGKTKPSNTTVLEYQLSKSKMSEGDGATSESLSGYDSESSVDSCQTGPFSVKSLSKEDIDNNNKFLSNEVEPNAVKVNPTVKMDKTMIRLAWDRIFGNNDTSASRQNLANRSVNEIMKEGGNFSVLKTIKNLNLSY